jgi:DNA polymerase III alpha subunit
VDAQKVNKRTLEALVLSGSMDGLAGNRASVFAQLPEAMRAAEQQARDAQAGQNDMFGGGSAAPVKLDLIEVEEWPIARKLGGERDTLGYYLSGHPTDAWRESAFARGELPDRRTGQALQTAGRAATGLLAGAFSPWPARYWACASRANPARSCRLRITPDASRQ